ncbi:MAG: hypothetical protein JXA03_12455 [Bacteroidales bacterium]|nr:hypothetical protein [Bacteroidales bacterium]
MNLVHNEINAQEESPVLYEVHYADAFVASGIEESNHGKYTFLKSDMDFNKILIYDDYLFLSSLMDSVIVITKNRILKDSFSLKGVLGNFTGEIYNPGFYRDNHNVYWGPYTDFHIIKFTRMNDRWQKKTEVSYENNFLPQNLNYIKIIDFQGLKILVEHASGNSLKRSDKSFHAAVYFWNMESGSKMIYEVMLTQPSANHSYLPQFPSLDVCLYNQALLVFDTYNEKMVIFNQNLQQTGEIKTDLSEVGCKPFVHGTAYPEYKGIKLIKDDKTVRLYFLVRNNLVEDPEEHLWLIKMDDNNEIQGYEEITTLNIPKHRIQQVYDNKIYYILKINGNSYICEQEMKHGNK